MIWIRNWEKYGYSKGYGYKKDIFVGAIKECRNLTPASLMSGEILRNQPEVPKTKAEGPEWREHNISHNKNHFLDFMIQRYPFLFFIFIFDYLIEHEPREWAGFYLALSNLK